MLKPNETSQKGWTIAVGYLGSSWAIAALSLLSPATAHTIKTEGDVAVTFHIDPDHNPKAGEKATAWFAMTRRGGQAIPLQECHCKLGVYLDSEEQDSLPTMRTALKSISAENHEQIPAAELLFPQSGIYRLEFSGTPKQEGTFKPFRLTYSVTVIPGAGRIPPLPESSPTSSRTNADARIQLTGKNGISVALLALAGGGAVLGAIASLLYRQRHRTPIKNSVKTKI